ncbi:DUF4132 domain-containing protein [Actinomyces sp. oral taxon 414]|uniref:DUF4132 domain-containing protein n=1 Tax=Actinomyces sp. oral taxon 414 TaxID=712122 RepID=UPI0006AE40F6|nr:DUF4132 domain-containing protein [Actinomyces sp. oral taxon 414]
MTEPDAPDPAPARPHGQTDEPADRRTTPETGTDEKAQARAGADPGPPIEPPPFASLLDAPSAAPAKAELRERINARIAELLEEDDPDSHDDPERRQLEQVTDSDIDRLIAIADGAEGELPSSLQDHDVRALVRACPHLHLLHRARIEARSQRPDFAELLYDPSVKRLDPRAVEQVLRATDLPERDWATWFGNWLWYHHDPHSVWPWALANPDLVVERLQDTRLAAQALQTLEHMPTIPEQILPTLVQIAIGPSTVNRPLARRIVARYPRAGDLAARALTGGAKQREAAAQWLAELADPAAVVALREALAAESSPGARAALLGALAACDEHAAELVPPRALEAEAERGLRRRPPASLAWFDFAALPALRWADGTAVDPRTARWWVVLADRLKDPSGHGMFELYLDRLDAADAAALGSHVLRAWIAQDTIRPPEEESRAHAELEGRRAHDRAQRDLVRAAGTEREDYARRQAAVPLSQHVERAYHYHHQLFPGSAIADKGLLALTVRMDGAELARAVRDYEATCWRWQGGHRAQLAALMTALAANGHPDALALLQSAARSHDMRSIQKTATALLEQVARWRGWSADELADRMIPTAGFDDDGALRLSYGGRTVIARPTPQGGVVLTDAGGKTLKSLPAARAPDDSEGADAAKRRLGSARRQVKAVMSLQTARLYEAMCASRTWPAPEWRELLADHPLVGRLVTRLIWEALPAAAPPPDGGARAARAAAPPPADSAAGVRFRPAEDGALLGVDDSAVELAPDAVVRLAHRTALSGAEADAWRRHLADYEVSPPFDQLGATAPDVPADAVAIQSPGGRRVTTVFALRRAATKRGYRRAPAGDGGWFWNYLKEFPSLGLTATINFSGARLPEEDGPCAVDDLEVRRGGAPVALGRVPPVLLAECCADFAALAALGRPDPHWRATTGDDRA